MCGGMCQQMSGMLIDTSLKKYLGKWLDYDGLWPDTCLHMFDILADKGAEVEYGFVWK